MTEFETLVRRHGIITELYAQSRASVNLDVLFENIAASVGDALDSEFCGIFQWGSDEDRQLLRSGTGWGEKFIGRPIEASERNSHLGYTLLVDYPVVFGERDPEPRYDRSALLSAHDVVAGIGVSIGLPGWVWGILGIYSAEQRAYTDDDIEFVRTVADLLSIVIHREHYETQLVVLDDLLSVLRDGGTRQDVCDAVVGAMDPALGVSVGAIYLYDETANALRLSAWTGRARDWADPIPFEEGTTTPEWQSFIGNEVTLLTELGPLLTSPVADASIAHGAVLPLSHHGILVTGTTGAGRTIENSLMIATFVASLARTTLACVEHEKSLRKGERTIERRTKAVEQLTAMNELRQAIDRDIIELGTRDRLERAVCERLVKYKPYVFAWVGSYDAFSEQVTPHTWTGSEKRYFGSATIDVADQLANQEPMGIAIHRREPFAIQRLMENSPSDRWHQEALKRGYRSVISVPIIYRTSQYGGITVYSDHPAAFDESECRFLRELGERLGYAFNAIETKTALLNGSRTELEFHVRDQGLPFVQWATQTGCEFEFQGTISRPDGSIRGFFAIGGLSSDRILDLVDRASTVTDVELVTKQGEQSMFECILTDDSVVVRVLDYGAVVTDMTADEHGGRLVIELPGKADSREFVDAFQTMYPDSKLVRHQEREHSHKSRHGFKADVENELTDRQLEALRTAYFSGYFEIPRETSGEGVASLLGIAQPTFNHHFRAAQGKLFRMLFDEERADQRPSK